MCLFYSPVTETHLYLPTSFAQPLPEFIRKQPAGSTVGHGGRPDAPDPPSRRHGHIGECIHRPNHVPATSTGRVADRIGLLGSPCAVAVSVPVPVPLVPPPSFFPALPALRFQQIRYAAHNSSSSYSCRRQTTAPVHRFIHCKQAMALSADSSSSTDANQSSSDDRDDRFYSQPLVRRQSSSSPASSSAASDSGSEDSSGPPDLPKRPSSSSHKPQPPIPAAKRPRDAEEEDKDAPKPPPKKQIVQMKAQPQPASRKPGVGAELKIVSSKKGTGAESAVKDSLQKSGKKPQQGWSAEDEVALARGVLALSGKPPELPKNMVPIYEQVKHLLSHDYSNSQLYDKMRRMKSKFQAVNEKAKSDGGFSFKSSHDATMFGIWKQLWGRPSASAQRKDAEDERKTAKNDREVQQGKDDEEEEENEEGEEEPEKNQGVKPYPSAGQACNGFGDESRAVVNEVKNGLQKMLEDAHSRTVSLVDSVIKARTPGLQCPFGDPVSGIYRTEGLALLNSKNTQALERKWREQHILEMETFSRRLALLQEDCRAALEQLKSPDDGGRG